MGEFTTLVGIQSLINGTSGSDRIEGTSNNDHINTLGGNDFVLTGDGNDEVNGQFNFSLEWARSSVNYVPISGAIKAFLGRGDDFLLGSTGNDEIYGESGNDVLSVGDGNDRVEGNDGNDVIFGGDGDDILIGGEGNDSIYDTRGKDQFFGGPGDDLLDARNFQFNGLRNDVSKFFGDTGNDTLYGSKGDDQLWGGAGDDYINGGWLGTRDTAFYIGNFSQFTLTAVRSNGGTFQDKFLVVDRTGNEGNDTVFSSVEYLNFNNGKTIVTLNNSDGSYTYVTLNSNPTGSVKIVGYLGVGSIINVTNTLSDEDGIGPIKYQWLSSFDGEKWLELGTGTSLAVGLNAAGNLLKVNATYTDFNGTIESVSSEQTIRIPDQIRRQSNNISLIVDKGVLGENAVLLNDLLEVKVWKNNRLVSQTIDFQNITYNFRDFELLSSIVIRNGDFTDDFKFEIDNYLQRNANLSLSAAIEIVGSLNFDQILLKIAGSDGNFVG